MTARLSQASCLLVPFVGLFGCADSSPLDDPRVSPRPPQGLSSASVDAWNTWRAADLDDYEYSLRTGCFCPVTDVTVTVTDGKVSQVRGVGRQGVSSLVGGSPTMENLFLFIGEATKGADQIDVQFYDVTGVPERVDIDYITDAIDDELSIEVNGFTAG